MQGEVLRDHEDTLVEIIFCRLRALDIPEQKDSVSLDVLDAAIFLTSSVGCFRTLLKASLLHSSTKVNLICDQYILSRTLSF